MTGKRITYFDAAKGFTVFLMIMGHCLQPLRGWLPAEIGRHVIYSFHMPFFFILAGYLKSDRVKEFGRYAVNKFIRLIVPFLFANAVFILMDLYCPEMMLGKGRLKDDLLMIVTEGGLSVSWFLLTLFFAEVLFELLKRMLWKYLPAVVALAGIIGIILMKSGINSPVKVGTVFTALFFYGLGYLTRKHFSVEAIKSVIPCVIVFAAASAGMYLIAGRSWEMNGNYCADPFLGTVAAFSGTAAIVRLFYKLGEPREKENRVYNVFFAAFEYIGIKSLFFYLFSGDIAMFLNHTVVKQLRLPGIVKPFTYFLVIIGIYLILKAADHLWPGFNKTSDGKKK